ncbi:MAG: sugar ABC transporter permease [Pseudobutyrivibrio sp.]|nr:sugar ABC transporter permease [Pseudobutyrivibrio sp.]
MLVILVLVFLFFTVTTNGQMFSPLQFNALITQNAYVYVLASGMLICMLTGGNIDLSAGSFVCFVGVIGAKLMVNLQLPTAVGIIAMLALGALYGCVLGYVIAYVNVPPWIATLAGYLALRGWGIALMDGASNISPLPQSFTKMFSGKVPDIFGVQGFNVTCFIIGIIVSVVFVVLQLKERTTKIKKGYEVEAKGLLITRCVLAVAVIILFATKLAQAGGIPFMLIWVAVIVLIYDFITSKTDVGRYFYTMGGNTEATRLSGVDTKKMMFLAYLNMCIMSVVAAWLTMSRFQAANSTAGTNYEMDAIAACVVGGVSAYGGSGSVFGMIVGATLIGVINLGMSLMGIDANWQKVVKGIVLLGAVVFEIVSNKKKTAANK